MAEMARCMPLPNCTRRDQGMVRMCRLDDGREMVRRRAQRWRTAGVQPAQVEAWAALGFVAEDVAGVRGESPEITLNLDRREWRRYMSREIHSGAVEC